MLINDLLTNNAWRSTHKGFRLNTTNGVVWRDVERTSKGRIRITRSVDGASWGKRIMQRYVDVNKVVVLVPLAV